jgi:AAA15 family ATPase/GTPase
MLLRFGVQNHLSLRDKQELSLVASSLDDVDTGLIDSPATAGSGLLPAVVIYGANASGKSNLISAFRWMRSAILSSHNRGEPGGGVPRSPFMLDSGAANAPSIFDADFVVEGVRYHYGFEASDEAFVTEWLQAFPNGRRQMLFEREGADFVFGRSLRGRNKLISELTRPNSLFVSAAAQNGHDELSKINGFFRSISQPSITEAHLSSGPTDGDIDRRVIDFLGNLDTGVIDHRKIERKIPEQFREFNKDLGLLIQKISKDIKINLDDAAVRFAVQLAHRGRDGAPVYFDLDRESEGTQRLLILLGPIFRGLDRGAPILIDELNASLHTQACEAILDLFSSPETNPKGAQLIATTHDTNLLRSPLLRRDQVWFTEKDGEGATHLYPLTDIRTRKGDNLARGYLQGRYGAIPFAGSASGLISAS